MESFGSFLLEKVSPEVNGGISHHHGLSTAYFIRGQSKVTGQICALQGFIHSESHGEKQTVDFFKKTTRHRDPSEIQVQSHHHTAPYNVQSRR